MIGARMKEIRAQLGLTQPQLVGLVGGAKNLFSDYENDRKPIPANFALALEALSEVHRLGGDVQAIAARS